MRTSKGLLFAICGTAFLLLAPFIGAEWISPFSLDGGDELSRKILLELRIPRVLAGVVVGAVLAGGGVVFQSLFQNPLASPFTLGVASGAALGAALFFHLGTTIGFGGAGSAVPFAMAGAGASMLFVYWISTMRGGVASFTMLLAGVIISFFCSSLIVFIQYLSDFPGVFRITRWLMGEVDVIGYFEVLLLTVVSLPCLVALTASARTLDLLAVGDEFAQSRGVSVRHARRRYFFLVSVMVGAVVAVCGPIAFVGIVVPHICRGIVGELHRPLLLSSIFAGSLFLVASDTVARSVIAPYELPVGICTALVGAPFFLHVLLRTAGRRGESS